MESINEGFIRSRILGAVCTCFIAVTSNASAAIVSVDWKTAGDNLITRDTSSGLEWLDLTQTANLSFNDVTAQLGVGDTFEGWSYATGAQVATFWDAFGGDNAHYDGWSTENNGLFEIIAPFWGQLACKNAGCADGEGWSHAILADPFDTTSQWVSLLFNDVTRPISATDDHFVTFKTFQPVDRISTEVGSALIRPVVTTSPVPLPGALWLFGSLALDF